VVEHFGVAGARDPCRAQVLHCVVRFAEHDLGDVRGLDERPRAARRILGARPFREPQGDALLGPVRFVEQPIEQLHERWVRRVDRQRALHVADGLRKLGEPLADHRERAKLEGERGRLADVLESRPARPRRLEPLACRFVEGDELVEDATVDAGDRRRACSCPLEQQDRSGVVAKLKVRNARRVELESRATGGVFLDLRFVRECAAEGGGVAVRGQVPYVRLAHGAHSRVQRDRPLQRSSRGIHAPEPPLKDLRTLLMKPRGQLRCRRIGVGHAPEVHRERIIGLCAPCGAERCVAGSGTSSALRGGRVFVRPRARRDLRLEPLQRSRVIGGSGQRRLPGRARGVGAIAERVDEPRLLCEQLDGRGLAGRAFELVFDVREHRRDRASSVLLASEQPVRGGERAVHVERELRVALRPRVVAGHLVGDGELEVHARERQFVVRPLERRYARLQEVDQARGRKRIDLRARLGERWLGRRSRKRGRSSTPARRRHARLPACAGERGRSGRGADRRHPDRRGRRLDDGGLRERRGAHSAELERRRHHHVGDLRRPRNVRAKGRLLPGRGLQLLYLLVDVPAFVRQREKVVDRFGSGDFVAFVGRDVDHLAGIRGAFPLRCAFRFGLGAFMRHGTSKFRDALTNLRPREPEVRKGARARLLRPAFADHRKRPPPDRAARSGRSTSRSSSSPRRTDVR